ncbi:MAG: cytochrome c3 family protein [Deltaproteobacteria bacterium]|nr:cytochrome c3 family protein [Deltaproteobacteria bacterium]
MFLGHVDPLPYAPGGEFHGCSTRNCHKSLAELSNAGGDLDGRYGCHGCHLNPRHHADDSATVVGETGGWYRFLSGHLVAEGHGVEGIEDPTWQFVYNANEHNEYLGLDMDKTGTGHMDKLAHTTTGYCTGCHGNFHIQDTTQIGASPWIRHPSDAVLPTTGEYAGYTQYDPLSPVARPSLPVAEPADVTPGVDMVMCLSCHRPHGSPYDDLLRWNYQDMQAGTSGDINTGCFACHRNKDTGS